MFLSGVPLSALGRVPLLRRPHRSLCFPRAALHGGSRLQRAPHIGHLPHHQVGTERQMNGVHCESFAAMLAEGNLTQKKCIISEICWIYFTYSSGKQQIKKKHLGKGDPICYSQQRLQASAERDALLCLTVKREHLFHRERPSLPFFVLLLTPKKAVRL